MVRIHPDPPPVSGAVAQLGEHLLCKQGVGGSNPLSSTSDTGCGGGGVAEGTGEPWGLACGLWAAGYWLFFNNWEEVKVLPGWAGGGASCGRVIRAGWVDCRNP
jgi:hypothetical protein